MTPSSTHVNVKKSRVRFSFSKNEPLPGDLAMWVLILAELTVFAVLFFTFIINRIISPEVFQAGQAQLHVQSGLYITLALLTASYFVAMGVNSDKNKSHKWAVAWFYSGALCGIIYIGIKLYEYSILIDAGFGLTGHPFFMYYFLITGFHLIHVLLGVGLLIFMAIAIQRRKNTENGLDSVASYWHMVDLVWLVLFPLLYLLK